MTTAPRPEHQCQEEKPPQHLAVKNQQILNIWVRWKANGNPDVFFKGLHTYPFAHRNSPRALVEGQRLGKHQEHTGRE